MVNYPGRSRVDAARARLDEAHQQAVRAVADVSDLRRQIETLRAEVKRLTIDLGEQLTRQSAIVERLQLRVGELEETHSRANPSAGAHDQQTPTDH
jgi:DNA repair exonuclease SbcCD ATPase subunit